MLLQKELINSNYMELATARANNKQGVGNVRARAT